mgnify:CR=1 FL=1
MRPRTLVEVFADPHDSTNNERAAKAAEKVEGYAGEKTDDAEADVVDLLVDIRHNCDAVGLDFGRLNRTARHHHEAEVGQHGLAKKTWDT